LKSVPLGVLWNSYIAGLLVGFATHEMYPLEYGVLVGDASVSVRLIYLWYKAYLDLTVKIGRLKCDRR
jgi:hypothetical protein